MSGPSNETLRARPTSCRRLLIAGGLVAIDKGGSIKAIGGEDKTP